MRVTGIDNLFAERKMGLFIGHTEAISEPLAGYNALDT